MSDFKSSFNIFEENDNFNDCSTAGERENKKQKYRNNTET